MCTLEYNYVMDSTDSKVGHADLLEKSEISVLVIAFQRFENLVEIFETCIRNGVKNIYVSIDVPKKETSDSADRSQKILNIVRDYSMQYPNAFQFQLAPVNRGCGISVLTGCDWVFSQEEFVVVLEDDCIPADDFFNFVSFSLPLIVGSDQLFIAVGTQFKSNLTGDHKIAIVKYPVFWGWATTRDQWKILKLELLKLLSDQAPYLSHLSIAEQAFWSAGCRRVLEGYVDTWDTLLTTILLSKNWKTISPLKALVRNVGNDDVATHTSQGSLLHNLELGKFGQGEIEILKTSPEIDFWMQNQVYKISRRHLISTKFTYLLDRLFPSRKVLSPLAERYIHG